MVIYESEADARDKHIWLEETFAWKWLWRRMEVGEVRDRGYEMGEELDGDELGAENPPSGGSANGSGASLEGQGGQFTIADDSDDEDEAADISGGGDEGARAFKAVVGNPPKSMSKTSEETEVQDPLQSSNTASDPNQEQGEKEEETIPCLIDRLFSCTIDLLFCAGFTVPESVKGLDGDKINVSPSHPPRLYLAVPLFSF